MWVEAVDELTDEECRRALTKARRRGGAFPCNLGEFVELAGRGNRHGPTYLGVPESAEDRQARLSAPPATRSFVDDCLARMRGHLPPRPQPSTVPHEPGAIPRDPRIASGCTCRPGEPLCDVCTAWRERMLS